MKELVFRDDLFAALDAWKGIRFENKTVEDLYRTLVSNTPKVTKIYIVVSETDLFPDHPIYNDITIGIEGCFFDKDEAEKFINESKSSFLTNVRLRIIEKDI